jgi:hypothetical protein
MATDVPAASRVLTRREERSLSMGTSIRYSVHFQFVDSEDSTHLVFLHALKICRHLRNIKIDQSKADLSW